MPLQIGIVGLPNVGKSTLFNALIRSRKARVENYPFCTIDPNVGVVEVPDKRLQELASIVKNIAVIPTTIEFVDIAGLITGASRGEGLGNQFLSHIRECDAIVEVVRLFCDPNVAHSAGSVDPERDMATIETELILADLHTVEKRRAKCANAAKTGDRGAKALMAALEPVREALERGERASTVELQPEQETVIRQFNLLTRKPMLHVFNVTEDQLVPPTANSESSSAVRICAKGEEDLIDLPEDEAREYLRESGIASSGFNRLICAAYATLDLITFFTAGPKEVRAWTVRRGSTAPEAAGRIHTDFQRGFICAEVIACDDFVACGGEGEAKAQGRMRREGREYVVRDGDVIHFRFNV